MKPIISYIRQTTLQKQTSIVRKKGPQGALTDFVDRDELVAFIQSISPAPGTDTVLYVRCCCYRDFIYTEYIDIPPNNVNCECGQKVIEYSGV